MTIYGERPIVIRFKVRRIFGKLIPAHRTAAICTKIILNGREISIALDDSCGAFMKLSRVNVRVYEGEEDVTDSLVPPDGSWMNGPELLALMKKVEALPPCSDQEGEPGA